MRRDYLIVLTGMALLVFSLVFAAIASGHGRGASLEEKVGEYLVDIGYEPETLQSEESAVFDFSLLSAENGEEVDFTDIWVKVSKGNRAYFASGLAKARIGKTAMTYVFSEGSEYTLFVRFQNEGEKIVETSFPLSVVEKSDPIESSVPQKREPGTPDFLIGGLVGLVAGFAASLFLKTRKGKKEA